MYSHKSGAKVETKPMDFNSEHDTVKSRLTGADVEIKFMPLPAGPDPSKGGLVPKNPYASKSQQRFMFAAEARGDVPKGTAKRWAHETPDIKSLSEKKRKK